MNKTLNYKNNTIVRVKTSHDCKYCGGIIPKGNTARTVNPKRQPRYWICNNCNNLITRIKGIKHDINNAAFGDEGGYLALQDYMAEVVGEFESRCIDEDIISNLYEYLEDKK